MFGLENTRLGRVMKEYLEEDRELRRREVEALVGAQEEEASFWQGTARKLNTLVDITQDLANASIRAMKAVDTLVAIATNLFTPSAALDQRGPVLRAVTALERCAKALEEMAAPLFEDPKPSKVPPDPSQSEGVPIDSWEREKLRRSATLPPDVIRPREAELREIPRSGPVTGLDPSKR